jgi:hypothetical protein
MALITDPDSLNQGNSTAVADLVFGTPTGNQVTLTSAGSNIPALADDEFFEIRDHSVPGNNGLYRVDDASPATNDITVDKLTGINPVAAGSEAATILGTTGAASEKSVHFDTDNRRIYLLEQGNLVTADGVTMLALHSFMKEEWKNDTTLPGIPFPMLGIDFDAGKWELGVDPSGNFNDWAFADDDGTESIFTRRAIRNAGWVEYDATGLFKAKFTNVTTLGSFEDTTNDFAHYAFGNDPTDTAAATDFIFGGPVNEPVQFYDGLVTRADGGTGYDFNNDTPDTIDRNDGGSWITDGYTIGSLVVVQNANTVGNDGTYEITGVTTSTITVVAYPGGGDAGLTTDLLDTTATFDLDNRLNFAVFLRVRDADPNGKTYARSDLSGAGESELVNKVIKYPLSNATDLNITETDANIAANSPYTEVRLRYLPAAYNREVDTTTKRDFGIVVDVGTYSHSNGVSATSTTFTSADWNAGAGEALGDYTGGTLIIHEGTDQGTHTISGTPTAPGGTLTVVLTVALTASESNLSFTMERASPLTATKTEIYEKIQYQLRQDADIDETINTVTGSTADELATFIGPDLEMGRDIPTNPNGGGSGVIIEGFDANDTNNLFFYDNGGTRRNFPFVAAGTLNFNANLVTDTDPDYWLFFEYTTRTTVSDFAISAASGSTASFDSAGANLPTVAQNDYVRLTDMTNEENNGIWIVTDASPTATQFDARKIDGKTVVNETSASHPIDQNPIDSPDAIIVNDNGGTPITGAASSASIAFDFDYDNNTQGGRTAATDANVVLRAGGLETGQMAEQGGLLITRNTGLSFSITSALERNYSNP